MYYKPFAGFCQFAPLDKSGGMGIMINTRGRCIRRSVPVSLKLYLDLNDPQKPSPCPVAVFAFQSLDSYRDRMTQNMNRKHEKHTVPPPFEEVTNRLTMYAASLRRVYTAGGFLSNNGGRTESSAPTRFVRDVGDGVSYEVARSAPNGTSRTPSPTKSQGVRGMGHRGRRPLRNRNGGAAKRADRCPPFTFHIIYDSAQRHDVL